MVAVPILSINDLKVHFPIVTGLLRRVSGQVKAVDGVSLEVQPGETVGLVGESGSGKTSLGRSIVRIVAATGGSIVFRGQDGQVVDVNRADHSTLRTLRRKVRMIFQDPHSSLDPRYTVGRIIAEPLLAYGLATRNDVNDRVAGLLAKVGLRAEYAERYPHAFSGGERQRIGIARSLAVSPEMIICDEPVSALDDSVQAPIINLLKDLQQDSGLTYLFISHDLSVVRHISSRVAVMYVGRLIEVAPTRLLFAHPRHPYTEALLSAVPVPDPAARGRNTRIQVKGEIADPANAPSGCHFHPRCRYATATCAIEVPPLSEVAPGHYAACHHASSLSLAGVASSG